MKVKLRKKSLTGNRNRLFLDFYPALIDPDTGKQSRREFLDLFLYTQPTNAFQKEHNKEALVLAENIRSNRELDVLRNSYNLQSARNKKVDFLAFFHVLCEGKRKSVGNYGNWLSTYNYLYSFSKGKLKVEDIDEELCKEFKVYLDKTSVLDEPTKKLSQNTKLSYFNKFKAALVEATRQKLFSNNPCEHVDSFEEAETQREFLTYDELLKLKNTDCDIPELKRASLFSALTGLRWCDVYKLMWGEVQKLDDEQYIIRFQQKKTSSFETLPINKDALSLLGIRGKADERVFNGLSYYNRNNPKLKKWIKDAGITKNITFHCFRHTFATLLLTLGEDIYTVSKLITHKHVSTTQIYAKVIDQKKFSAVNKIQL
jgi:site-specific recombinase XerD